MFNHFKTKKNKAINKKILKTIIIIFNKSKLLYIINILIYFKFYFILMLYKIKNIAFYNKAL